MHHKMYDIYVTTMLAEIATVRLTDDVLAGLLENILRSDAADIFGFVDTRQEQEASRAALEEYLLTNNIGTLYQLTTDFYEKCTAELKVLNTIKTIH